VERSKASSLTAESVKLDCGFRADLVVDGTLAVELKCKEALHPVDEAQLLSHAIAQSAAWLLINFHVVLLKDGIKRLVNNYVESDGRNRICDQAF
jgi:GxxExxY protein